MSRKIDGKRTQDVGPASPEAAGQKTFAQHCVKCQPVNFTYTSPQVVPAPVVDVIYEWPHNGI